MTQDAPTREQAAEILHEAVPGAEVISVARMDLGAVNGAYEVVCEDPAQSAVLKLYAQDSGWRLSKEISIYRLLRENGVTKIPKLLGADDSDGLLGRPYLLMSKVPGLPLEKVSPNLSDTDLRSVYKQMGELAAQFHAIGQDAYGFLITEIIDPQPTNEAQMRAILAEASQVYLDATGDKGLYENAHAYVAERIDLFSLCDRPVLIHNDFHEGNVIVEQTPDGVQVTGVIDMENALAGDPMVDLSKTHSYSIKDNRVKLEGLFEGYGCAPVEWERRFRLFQAIHLFQLWKFFYGLEPGTPERIAEDLRAIIAAG